VTPASLMLRIVRHLPSPTALTFLAGLFAGAGINMLTSAAVGEAGGTTRMIVLDALAWVAAAGFLTAAAQRLDGAEREASVYIMDPNLSPIEKQAERAKQIEKVANATAVLGGLTILALVAAILLLPGLVG
jgi:hypothetical protein